MLSSMCVMEMCILLNKAEDVMTRVANSSLS